LNDEAFVYPTFWRLGKEGFDQLMHEMADKLELKNP
jgi:hypothetical protein